ncbi:septation ring formation regulator EzrA [Evansella tamaricis]|uniref:Septation ring formation regulator EzrA n=1 Tax=Evansella tamaricis TaxID=2069301 RepID=A0ABS6JQI8_9BACI|nr:septation ring formation regulator EzrA [Evansella tamaricis]MBU9714665.1 septation ring formation regulator EzrA [Evansella tamaricis]
MFIYYVYGILVLLLFIIVYGAWSRKLIYKQVDRLESKKIQLMNTPVTEELSKIKSLKMSGETQERFEEWRNEWDEIITLQLPDMEEKLFDIEDMANKYRFGKAKKIISFVDEEFNKIKEHMDEMIEEVDQLVHSEEQNREEIGQVKDLFNDVKKKLWSHKGQLSGSTVRFERYLKETQSLFTTFESETDSGNYLQARDVLQTIRDQINFIDDAIEKVPKYLVQIEKDIPKQIEALEKGLVQMEEEGYPIKHFSFKWQVKELKKSLLALLPLVENLKIHEVTDPIDSIQNHIDDIYEKLEQEVLARKHVEDILPSIKFRVEKLPGEIQRLRADTEKVKLSYRISDEEDKKQLKLEKNWKDIQNQLSVMEDGITEKKQTFTSLMKMLQDFELTIGEIESQIEESRESLNHLRRNERTADEAIRELKERLLYAQRKLKRSNLPGIPHHLLDQSDRAQQSLRKASEKLNELPISMEDVIQRVDEATGYVNECVENLFATMEEAKLAESVIQYGNRYRRDYDDLNIKLLQAEDCFRHYQYEEALELALEGLKPIVPDVLEKVTQFTSLQKS